MQADNYF